MTEVDLDQGFANFFSKGLDNKYFSFYAPYNPYHKYSTLTFLV